MRLLNVTPKIILKTAKIYKGVFYCIPVLYNSQYIMFEL